jgi:hypothetical protein
MHSNTSPGRRLNALHPDTAKTLAHLEALCESGFWGTVRVKFESGRATHIIQEESLVPANLSEFPRSQNANRKQ